MQGIILALLMWSRFLFAFLVCSPLLIGNTFAGGPKKTGIPTDLVEEKKPLPVSQIQPRPVTPVVVALPVVVPLEECDGGWVSSQTTVVPATVRYGTVPGVYVSGACAVVSVSGWNYAITSSPIVSGGVNYVCKPIKGSK